MNVEEICHQAQGLTQKKRTELIQKLLEGLGASCDYDVSDDEVLERVNETREGHVQDISHQQLISGLKHLEGR
jgi:uncharacterized tellurite resistance protein B-like protein